MSRHAITSIYETTIASRPHTLSLLNEITNSKSVMEAFNRVYSPWFKVGENYKDRKWDWSWPPSGPGYPIKEVSGYTDLVKKQQYPNPNQVGIDRTPGDQNSQTLANLDRVLSQSMMTSVFIEAHEWHHQYQMLAEDLYTNAVQVNMAANDTDDIHTAFSTPGPPPGGYGIRGKTFTPMAVSPVKALIESKQSIWKIETTYNNARMVRFKLRDEFLSFIIIYFAKIQNIMPIKDILRYPNVMALLKAMVAAQSKRSKRSTKSSEVKQVIPGLIDETDDVLVVEPQSWGFSRRYFGEPMRRSLINKGEVLRGAKWCTSASSESHFIGYVERSKNHLYYFVRKTPEEELGAIRTAGGYMSDRTAGEKTWDQLYKPFEAVYATVEYRHRLTKDSIGQDFMSKLITAFHKDKNDASLAKIIEAGDRLKKDHFKSYCNVFALELRTQDNQTVDTYEEFLNYFKIDWNWVQSHLKFSTLFD